MAYKSKRSYKRKPYVQKSKGYAKKFKKDWKAGDLQPVICYTPRICPDIMRCTLPYVRTGQVTGSGIPTIVFRGNGLFDPDVTSVGQQPLGFDQWSAFFRRYRVLAYNVKVYAGNQDTSKANDSAMVFISPANTSAVLLDPSQLMEQPLSQKRLLSANGGMDRAMFELYVDVAKMRGVPRQALRQDDTLSALVTANPAQETFVHLGGFDVTSILDTINLDFMVEINYYCEFFDRETLVRS